MHSLAFCGTAFGEQLADLFEREADALRLPDEANALDRLGLEESKSAPGARAARGRRRWRS
jgi:hypothetical protein